MLEFQKAIKQMDKYSRQEVLDNDWLKREVGYWYLHQGYRNFEIQIGPLDR